MLSDDAASIVVHALITFRLDNGNAVLFGISLYLMKKLQHAIMLQHVFYLGKENSILIFIALHWLPIKQIINYKILLLTWKHFTV